MFKYKKTPLSWAELAVLDVLQKDERKLDILFLARKTNIIEARIPEVLESLRNRGYSICYETDEYNINHYYLAQNRWWHYAVVVCPLVALAVFIGILGL
jgi:hypothetical protein